MSTSVYRLIDGPFFYKVCERVAKLAGVTMPDVGLWALGAGAYRTIYYDALPVQKPGQGDHEYQQQLEKKLAFLNRIRGFQNMQVKDGITRLKTEGRKQAASQVLEQKGVDTWIAVDAVKYALTGVADEIEIFTADSDIYPVFEVIRETRARGVLRYEIGKTRDELIYSADAASPIKLAEVMQWLNLPAGLRHARIGPHGFAADFEAEFNGKKFLFGRHQNVFVASVTSESVANQWVEASNCLLLIDWINDLGPSRPWTDFEDLICRLKSIA